MSSKISKNLSEILSLQELAELVPRFMQSPASKAPEDAARLRDLRLKAATLLGKGHWTYFLATFAWLQKCFRRGKQIVVIAVCSCQFKPVCRCLAGHFTFLQIIWFWLLPICYLFSTVPTTGVWHWCGMKRWFRSASVTWAPPVWKWPSGWRWLLPTT